MPLYPEATYKGPVPGVGGPMGDVKFFVIHISQSPDLPGIDSWFHDPVAQVSAHFGVGQDGTVYQWVNTDTVAWHCADYNGLAIGIEHVGFSGGTLTLRQAEATMNLLKWLKTCYPQVPLDLTYDVNGTGVIGHGALGIAGGAHPDCPGAPILEQFSLLLSDPTQPGSPASRVPPDWRPPGQLPILQPGGKNPQQAVVFLRACLREAGYWPKLWPLHPGGFGRLTQNALIRYKRDQKLAPNAICGRDSWESLGAR